MWYALGLISTGVYLGLVGLVLAHRFWHTDRLDRIVEYIANIDRR